MNVSNSPLPLSQGGIVNVTEEPTHLRTNQRPVDSTRGMAETSTQRARMFCTRVKCHSAISWSIKKPGLVDFVVVPSDNLTASNVFSKSRLQQTRILCGLAIWHEGLCSISICNETVSLKLVEMDRLQRRR